MKKKNWILRIATIAIILAVASAFLVSGTFAKYVTSETGSDTARVAAFGVVVSADADIFTTSEGDEVEGYSMLSGDASDVLAPGTTGETTFFTFSGTPEVAVEISFEVTGAGYSADWKVSDEVEADDYFPLLFTATYAIDGDDDVVVADGLGYAAFLAALDAYTSQYEAGTDISVFSLVVSWEWPFEVNDEADTYLGGLATAPTFELGIKATVTQLDTIDIS